jgi:hypothetical protein
MQDRGNPCKRHGSDNRQVCIDEHTSRPPCMYRHHSSASDTNHHQCIVQQPFCIQIAGNTHFLAE